MNSGRLKILVIDDDPAYRRLAQEALIGYERLIASTYADGLTLFKSREPDVVFLDIQLPDGNGLDGLLQMRAQRPEAFIVMLTSSRHVDDVKMAQRHMANGYITKPFSRKQMLAHCDAGLAHRQKIQAMPADQLAEFRRKTSQTIAEVQVTRREAVAVAEAEAQRKAPPKKILLFGSQEQMQPWMNALNGKDNYQASFSQTMDEAFDMIKANRFSLLVIEDMPPTIKTDEFLYKLLLNQSWLPSVVLVDADWKQKMSKWQKVQASRVLITPIDPNAMFLIMEEIIRNNADKMDDIFIQS